MADGEQTAQTARNTQADGVQDAAGNQGEASEAQTPQFEPLTVTYERLRHSTDPQELHEFARRSRMCSSSCLKTLPPRFGVRSPRTATTRTGWWGA